MIVRLALRSLAVRPVRTAVLACGFGLGIAVMAALLGVGDVILEQARSPELQGGGDMLVAGAFGPVENAPFVLSTVRTLAPTASPTRRATIYLINRGDPIPVLARGGVPSLEKAIGDGEVKNVAQWTDAPSDARWTHVDPAAVLRELDRFHPQPDVPDFASSWAEWLYFNGRTRDGRLRFYLTFIVGPTVAPGIRSAGVHLQLDRDGQASNYIATGNVDERTVLEHAPDLDIAGNHVKLNGQQYEMALKMPGVAGRLTLDPAPGRSLPPVTLRGARGWISGYVVPVLSGRLGGTLTIGGEAIAFDGADGYHDHNWGFWRDVRWQWGQVSGDGLSFIYGRVFPPADIVAVDRIPGFLGVLDDSGLLAVATNVLIIEHHDDTQIPTPTSIDVTARSNALDLKMSFSTDRTVKRPVSITGGRSDFIQLGGTYHVHGHAGGRTINLSARGAAETFQQR
ncbi:MAG TPA: hypothetical protein VFP91_19410 [Vicinamibacterales bacterium]|nr:hypothetical protein [Vicinamibacterales bacterium]